MIQIHQTSISIISSREKIWSEITNVKIDSFQLPWYLKLLGIPKPLKATVTKEGLGGHRIAEFENGGRFTQEIIKWDVNKAYAFKFNADPAFRVAHFFNLRKGPIIIKTGGYEMEEVDGQILLSLETTYEILSTKWLLSWLFPPVLKLFAGYLLSSIKARCEQ